MQSENRDPAYLWDMLEAAPDIVEFATGLSYTQFSQDKKTRFAVERQLMVIGEAASHVTENFHAAHPEISWVGIVGQRNVLAHEYGEILVERIWLVVQKNIPNLVQQLSALIPNELV
jgi:uncharacterized protein with HEPN domain